jgi:cytochrome b subunit of formate dehydrogenase
MPSRSDPGSPVAAPHLAATCGLCHAEPKLSGPGTVKRVQPLAAYSASVHAGTESRGPAASCSGCHGSHDILASADPRSRVHRERIPETCGACHAEIARVFASSVHGRAAASGIRQAPVCTDCHGEHRILGPGDQGSPVYATNLPRMTCGRCHGDLRVTEEFGLEAGAVATFEDSFHGLAGLAGNVTVANCASCHGVHDILPSSDPRSHVHPTNLAATCGTCHPGAGARFAIGTVHVMPGDPRRAHPAVYWIRLAYLWLIAVVIGAMALHNALDLRRKALSPPPRPVTAAATRRERMSLGFRVAHGLLVASFAVLVWTGFALRSPGAWWAAALLAVEERFALRGTLHRGAALVLLGAFAFHAVHLAVDRGARACISGMLPRCSDLSELRERVRWLLGRRAEMPRSPTLGYVEKIEYLAVVWGTGVMAATGFLLWFETWSLAHLPKWVGDVAAVVHFYEAVLASLAIVVWHLYFVVFDPVVYPMDGAWLSGREAPGRTLERAPESLEPARIHEPDDDGSDSR